MAVTYTADTIPFLQRGMPWPPPGDFGVERLRRYAENELLFRGKHELVYKDWVRLLREDQKATLELAVDFPGAVSRLFADLLFGETPRFAIGDMYDSAEQKWLDTLIEENGLHTLNYAAALAQSFRGDVIYKVRLEEGRERAVIETVPASLWYPVVDPDNVKRIIGHVIAWEKIREEGSGKNKPQKVRYLRAEIHLPGSVHQRLWRLEQSKEGPLVIGERADLRLFYDQPPPEDQETGVAEPLVVHVPNLELDNSPFGLDDYTAADTLFQELDIRLAQISRVLDKHVDPNMYGPPLGSDEDEERSPVGHRVARIGGRYFEVDSDQVIPGYLVWDAQLSAAFEYLDRLLYALYIATDTNEAAFSLLKGGNVPSGTALKRLLMRPLARTNRKRVYFDWALRRVIKLAAKLEAANGRDLPIDPADLALQIDWRDGLPEDPEEAARIEQIRTGGKATSSVWSAIRRLDGGPPQSIEREIERIREEEMAEAAPMASLTGGLIGELDFGETGE